MKNLLSTITLISVFALASAQAKYTVDSEKSTVAWHAEKVTGEHDGNVKIKSGNLTTKAGELTGGSVEIDMTSITCSDIENPEYNAKLVKHLKSDDFFSVEKHPTAKLVISQVKSEGKGKYNVMGKMTIKNITNDIAFTANLIEKGNDLTGSADITIDRAKYNVRYGSGSFFEDLGDKTIYDEFTLKVNIIANKKS